MFLTRDVDIALSHRCACSLYRLIAYFFFFNDTATTEIYTLSLHDALPILGGSEGSAGVDADEERRPRRLVVLRRRRGRSEEHTSELQSPDHLVCRLLLEKKNNLTRIPCQFDLLETSRRRFGAQLSIHSFSF